MRAIITGASGLLGSAIYDAFTKTPATVLGLAHSKPSGALQALDLTDANAVEKKFTEFFGAGDQSSRKWVIHCAAERRPDVAQKDPEGTKKLNISVPATLAELSKRLKFTLIYISTDYVFDGTNPPYYPSSKTNPLQLYGQTKRGGEEAVLNEEGADAVVFRVPVLYGPAPQNSDSAVNILLDIVRDQSGKTYKMDHYATRYPTNIVDIANFFVRLISKPPATLPKIVHYSAAEPFTKYEMCLIFAKILGLPHKHIIFDAEEPKGDAVVARPGNTQLYVGETEDLGVEGGMGCCGFEEWWEQYLKGHSGEHK